MDHAHVAFQQMWDNGAMDNADGEVVYGSCGALAPNCPYAYADNSAPAKDVDPYFAIAKQFGFANYMFQTNQGPSFPAHQFLFSGTSAPVSYPTTYYDWFAAENPGNSHGGIGTPVGCLSAAGSDPTLVLDINNTQPYTESATYIPINNDPPFRTSRLSLLRPP